ncbi:tetratricopeptide repeat protein [Roseibium sp.]|uniref:tetratricopeptide repeat protein n=1 Tax=Roseibium sp. TaxID=1936156 RepID=UPI003BABEFD2
MKLSLIKSTLAVLMLGVMTTSAGAVDPDEWDTKPPEPTPTSKECADGEAWDEQSKKCVKLDARVLDDQDRFRAARELAYAGRLGAAELALDAMTDQTGTRLLTYRGFLARKSGDWEAARVFYDRALAVDPDNLAARSYLGMGLVERGELEAARQQLSEIRLRGGRETWPERALLMSLRTGGAAFY